jgi:hypothetical protein
MPSDEEFWIDVKDVTVHLESAPVRYVRWKIIWPTEETRIRGFTVRIPAREKPKAEPKGDE